jgi:hypothetical protein
VVVQHLSARPLAPRGAVRPLPGRGDLLVGGTSDRWVSYAQLTQLGIEGRGLPDIADELGRLFGQPASLLDRPPTPEAMSRLMPDAAATGQIRDLTARSAVRNRLGGTNVPPILCELSWLSELAACRAGGFVGRTSHPRSTAGPQVGGAPYRFLFERPGRRAGVRSDGTSR